MSEVEWELARKVCTPAEFQALRTRERLALAGRDHGYRSVGLSLGIAWTTARDRLVSAEQRILRAQAAS